MARDDQAALIVGVDGQGEDVDVGLRKDRRQDRRQDLRVVADDFGLLAAFPVGVGDEPAAVAVLRSEGPITADQAQELDDVVVGARFG